MSNELVASPNESLAVVPALSELGVAKYADDKAFGAVAAGGGFLPRLMLMGGNSTAVKEGKIGIGRYALVRGKDQIEDLTPECPILVLGWRPKAMQMSDEAVISIFNHNAAEFKRIAAKADSGEQDTGCMYGPEYLVWVPSAKSFASYYMASKTARREAPLLKSLIGKTALLKNHLIKQGKHSWHGPIVTIYSQPLSDMPTRDEILEQAQRFNNPPETESEAAPEEAPDARVR